ncbi:helix-turn-helix domain-containing protein [Polymorphobacter multimanifer]|uniref:helix-turn-helix domain-containing protein n=1 Tax=Polymorphobacter multimanifer TaxID=1070431 RepID=UPI0016646A00|nr:helix-turn-helix domain-containing protein [Polymorphobacter multimanifer]
MAGPMDQFNHQKPEPLTGSEAQALALEAMPEALVLTNPAMHILAANRLFLDLVGLPDSSGIIGKPLGSFLPPVGLGPADIDDRGTLKSFVTTLHTDEGDIDVDVSAVATVREEGAWFGFCVRRPEGTSDPARLPLVRSVEHLTELVGRVPLKEIVRESTDLIERHCIKAALRFTADNRASAAEILGLSPQSLYSTLHRHGLGNLVTDND